jgi:CheY-like chemotaxis protein
LVKDAHAPAEPLDLRGSRQQDFHDLMRFRIMEILLVASPYERFLLEEAGELEEQVLGEFRSLDLHYTPGLTAVSKGSQALDLARRAGRFNLIITTPHVGDMSATELAKRVRDAGLDIPVALLAYDARDLKDLKAGAESGIERAFLWQGDARILLAIVKCIEDKWNVDNDTRAVGVQVILLVEDSVRYYSSFLPVIYAELLHHSRRLVAEGQNLSQKIMRMRARPKIVLCGTFEEAWAAFESHEKDILGLVSDIEFPKDGAWSAEAGLELARRVRAEWPDVPILLQSSRPENEAVARTAGAHFLLKGSPTLLTDLREFLLENLGFGDFVFRLPNGAEVDRAADLRDLEEKLLTVPAESIAHHAERNHFSIWLKARTEFGLAHELRPRTLSDFEGVEDLRRGLIESIERYRRRRTQTVVADFDRESFDEGGFYRIGGGSLGGKARGLAFARILISEQGLERRYPGVDVRVPPSAVIGTDAFDRFLDGNDLRDLALETDDDTAIQSRFLAAEFPEDTAADLRAFLALVRHPIAVRSSSLLEDSLYQPFSGVYETYMLPNDDASLETRLARLLTAVKRVYASTFSRRAKAYVAATPFRLEEEKMAIVLQRVVGAAHGERFYPDFAGVCRSHNFYPTERSRADEGICSVALGLGKTVVEGGACLRFCPAHPHHLLQFSSVADMLRSSQREFWALRLGSRGDLERTEGRFELDVAEADGTLQAVGSSYSRENDAVYEGLSRPGVRLVTFAPILKHGTFPLAEIVTEIMAMGEWGMNAPVEIEFAVNLRVARGTPREFAFLQMRRLVLSREWEALEVEETDRARLVCRSANVLGNGKLDAVRDLVVVDADRFERGRSAEVAEALSQINAALQAEQKPYLLIGVGRWGSRDPWLGIPVTWDQISGARAIVEAGFRDLHVTPSQGSHFFQNIVSFNVGYFTVNPGVGDDFVDWEWLAAQPAVKETTSVRHLRFTEPVVVKMNGRRNQGVILKPQSSGSQIGV